MAPVNIVVRYTMLPYLLLLSLDVQPQPRIPPHFEPNQGQVGGETEWIAKAKGGTLYIKRSAIAFETSEPAAKPRIMHFVGASRPIQSRDRQGADAPLPILSRDRQGADAPLPILSRDRQGAGAPLPILSRDRQGAGAPTRGQGIDPTGGYSNYFDGRDEKNWRTGIPHYVKVRYSRLYKGIDLIYYASKEGQIEYDLEAQPGADLHQIELAFEGFDKIAITPAGDLALDSITQHRPKIIQASNEIPCAYKLSKSNRVTLDLAPYDDTLPLTVDPVLEFATYFGGPGSDTFSGVALDSAGNILASGTSETPSNPTLDPFQQTNTVVEQAFIAKFTPNADKLFFYSTLRTSYYSIGNGINLDPSGNLILYGTTGSGDFPLKNPVQTTKSAFGTGFFMKFSPDGRTIVYSSYFGGSGGSDAPDGGIVDTDGSFIFTGYTESHDIPIANALQPHFGGGTADCYVAKVDPKGSLIFSTYFGGDGTDYCRPIAFGPGGSIYFGGVTWSDDLPLKDPIQTTLTVINGYQTAFIARLSSDGRKLEYGTMLGGTSPGSISSIALNSKGEIYLGGDGFRQPPFTTVNAFQSKCEANYACGLIMKLDPTGQKILNSTFLGGTGDSFVSSIKIGSDDSVYIVGTAGSGDFPSLNSLFPFAPDKYIGDGFLAKFLGDLRTLVFSTFLGPETNVRQGVTLDSTGRVYLAGYIQSDAYPVKNAFQKTFGGGGQDGFLLRISDSTVALASPLTASPGQVQFKYVQGNAPIAAQNVQVTSADMPVSFIASANASWVTVLPQAATTPVTLSVGAVSLAPGNYSATVTLTPNSGAPLSIPVALKILLPAPVLTSVDPSFVAFGSDDTIITLHGSGFTPQTQLLLAGTVWGPPVTFVDSQTLQTKMSYLSFLTESTYPFSAVNPQSDISAMVTVSVGRLTPVINGVVNAASQLGGPLAPGELIQVTGTNFGPPAQLSVLIGGILATIVSSSDTQALAIVPLQTPMSGNTTVVLTSGSLNSIATILPSAPVAPGIFTSDGSGAGQALITGTASPGSQITLFATGGGDLTLPITMSINGEDAPVASVTPVDGKPGWFQVTASIPADAPADAPVSVTISVGGQTSQSGVTLALQTN